MDLVKPDIGLLFWMTTCFILLLILMRKFAWGPILKALDEREQGIQLALDQAEAAKKQIAEATEKVTEILQKGRAEKEELIKATQADLAEYKQEQQTKINAQIESKLDAAKQEILQQKRAALGELTQKVGELSVEIAEKILEKELENHTQSNSIIENSLKGLEIK
ncbi:MAG: ATP synthase F0 subunit B [Flavobacteriales bacterium]|nr:ATP synthase F0 subunit B [Flavobacteriales bacterium]